MIKKAMPSGKCKVWTNDGKPIRFHRASKADRRKAKRELEKLRINKLLLAKLMGGGDK